MKQTWEEHTCHHPRSPGTQTLSRTQKETGGASELLCILFELAVIRNTFLKTGELRSERERKRGFPLFCMSLTSHTAAVVAG